MNVPCVRGLQSKAFSAADKLRTDSHGRVTDATRRVIATDHLPIGEGSTNLGSHDQTHDRSGFSRKKNLRWAFPSHAADASATGRVAATNTDLQQYTNVHFASKLNFCSGRRKKNNKNAVGIAANRLCSEKLPPVFFFFFFVTRFLQALQMFAEMPVQKNKFEALMPQVPFPELCIFCYKFCTAATRRETGGVWCLPPVWNLRAVVGFHLTTSSLVLLSSPVNLSVLPFFFCLPAGPFSWILSECFQYFSLRDRLFVWLLFGS